MAHTQLQHGSQHERDVVNELAEALDDLEALAVANEVGDGTITTAKLDDDAVTEDKLADDAVATAKILDANVTAAKLAAADAAKIPGTPTFALGAEADDARVVTITLKDIAGATKAAASPALVWISDTAGAAPSAVAPNGATSITTGTVLAVLTTKVLHLALCNGSGVIALTITETTAKNFYVNVAYGGVVASSAVVAFA
jgi:hypothetical protein